ncbi:MAG: COQ9 family protein [Rhodospirillales bacterium]|nr:COQ9 family protein [Rhodospirillales bacterium]
MRKEIKVPDDFVIRFLDHVVFDGWSRRALEAAAQDVGLDNLSVRRVVPNGPRDMVWAFNDMANTEMIAALAKINIDDLPVRERIGTAVRVRLEQNAVHQEAVRKMLSYLALPRHAVLAAKCAYETVDSIWRISGDTSTDFNFYTKRGLLAGVYGSTVLYWLSDVSENHEDTWDFLERRIANVMQIPKLQSAIKERVSRMPSPGRLLKQKPLRS